MPAYHPIFVGILFTKAAWYQGWHGPPPLALLLLFVSASRLSNPASIDHTGTRFLLGFIENRFLVEQPRPKVFVVVAGSHPATVFISVPLSSYTPVELTILPGTGIEHTFDYDLHLFDIGVNYNKVVLVESDVPVVVSGASLNDRSSDAYLVLPARAMGTEYVIMSYVFNGQSTGQQQGPSSAAILALEDVELTIQFPDLADLDVLGIEDLLSGSELHVSLSQYDTFQIRSKYFGELTGARVTSTSPVSVVAGSTWTSVSQELMGDHLIENLPPVNTWGTTFYIVPIANRTGGDIIRILGHTDNTQVRVLQEDPTDLTSVITSTLSLNSRHFVDIDSPSDTPLVIMASRRVLVAQFCKSHSVDNFRYSDPFMAIIPPATQYLNKYYFMTISTRSGQSSFYNYLNIVCETSKLSGLRLNDLTIGVADLQWGWVPVATSPMSASVMPITNGTYVLMHIDPDVNFNAMLYGFQWQESYGMLLGQNLRSLTYKENCLKLQQNLEDFFDNDCDGLFDEEIANGIDDDGDGLIDEDVFNDKRARPQNLSTRDNSSQMTTGLKEVTLDRETTSATRVARDPPTTEPALTTVPTTILTEEQMTTQTQTTTVLVTAQQEANTDDVTMEMKQTTSTSVPTSEVTTLRSTTARNPSTSVIFTTEQIFTTEYTTSMSIPKTSITSTSKETPSTVDTDTSTPAVTTQVTTLEAPTTQLAPIEVATSHQTSTAVSTEMTTDVASTRINTVPISTLGVTTADVHSTTILDLLISSLPSKISTQVSTQTLPAITDDVTPADTVTSAAPEDAVPMVTVPPYSFNLLRDDPLMVVIPFVILVCIPLIVLAVLVVRSALASRRERSKPACPPKIPPPKLTKAKPFKPKAAIVDCR